MKYMSSEWTGRLDHWMDTLTQDFYLPLGELEMEAFFHPPKHCLPSRRSNRLMQKSHQRTQWGTSFSYAWFSLPHYPSNGS